jgi:serine/threonine protein kinase
MVAFFFSAFFFKKLVSFLNLFFSPCSNKMDSRITLGKKLGEGAMGKVFLATYVVEPKTKKTISSAVKQVPAYKMDIEEVQLQAQLSKLPQCNEHIACYYDLFQDSRTRDYLIVMEYVDGQELWDYIKDHPVNDSRKLIDLFMQALEGLKFIHSKGIAHGDIKLENFMITHNGKLKYIDFGFGCSEKTCNTSHVWHGTSFLAPPEAYGPKQTKHLDAIQKVDSWALGSVFAELIASAKRGRITRADDLHMDGKSVASESDDWKASNQLPVTSNKQMKRLYDVVDALMHPNPKKRASAKDALKMILRK